MLPRTLAVLFAASLASAQTYSVSIPAAKDATYYRADGQCGVGDGLHANGAGQFVVSSYDDCMEEGSGTGLLEFDVASHVPAGASIVSVRLEVSGIEVLEWPGVGCKLVAGGAHWTEGPSDPAGAEWYGAPPQPGDVNLFYASYPTTTWGAAVPSGSALPQILEGTMNVLSQPWFVPSSPALVARVQEWLDVPSTNCGWMCINSVSDLRFASREHPTLAGPTLIVEYDLPCLAPVAYCVAAPNSAGPGATLGASGSTRISQGDFALTLAGGLPNGTGFFFYGDAQQQTPWGHGFLCVGGSLVRLLPAVHFDGAGACVRPLDFGAFPAIQIAPGDTWNFQCKYRDIPAGAPFFNASDGLSVTFCP